MPGQPTETTATTRTLSDLKQIVDRTLNSTIECGMALREIRDRKLFLEECGSFQEFCEKNWRVTRARAYQLIGSADMVDSLPESVSTQVDTEKAARTLRKVPKKDREAVIQAAAKTGKVNEKSINAAAAKIIDVEQVIYDKTGFEIPSQSPAMQTWLACGEVQDMLTAISRVKCRVAKAIEDKEPMFSEVNGASFAADIQNTFQLLKVAIPYTVCPTCQGRVISACYTCSGRGMISEFYWKFKVPVETKKTREKAVALLAEKKKGKK